MGAQFFETLLNSPTVAADGTALANSTTLTDISPASQLVLPANMLYKGALIRVKARGRVSTTGTPTLLLGVYYGGVAGTALAASAATTMTSGVSNVPWSLEVDLECRAVGASGSLFGIGHVFGISGTAGVSVVPIPASAPAAVTVDTTAAKALTVGAQWGTPSASNTITCHLFTAEALN